MKNNYTLGFGFISIFIFLGFFLSAQTTPVLWGLTFAGGAGDTSSGTIFSINGDGTGFNTVVNFSNGAKQGASPDYVQLVQASNGKFYGTTTQGGTYTEGVIFSLDPSNGNYAVLHSFNDTAGAFPYGGLIQATNGKLYGMTNAGGVSDSGTIYSFDPSTNTFSSLFSFDSANGTMPYGSLFQASSGRIYGLTSAGGANDFGVIFTLDPNSGAYQKVFDFAYATGASPFSSLAQTADGKLYGTASVGGASNYYGTIFSLDTGVNTYTDLYDFNDTLGMGITPYGNLTPGPNNLLYGMTVYGGADREGAIFSFDPNSSTYTTLFNLNDTVGSVPRGSLTLADNGSFYGMASYGGANNLGTLFRFNPLTSDFKKLFDFDSTSGYFPFGSLTINGSVATGIGQAANNPEGIQFQLFPNPSGVYTMVSASENALGGTLCITDLTGRAVMDLKLNALITRLDLNDMASGMYNATLRTGSYTCTKLLVKN